MDYSTSSDCSSIATSESKPNSSKEKSKRGKRPERHERPDTSIDDMSILATKGFMIGDELNSGTFATVRYAEYQNKKENRKLAVKIIDKTKGSPQFIQKFLPRELFIWPDLHHTSIIRVHKIIGIQSRIYVFMDLARNGSVIQYLQSNGAVSEYLARRWFNSLARALRYCHKKGVAHRDVKCDNLLLDDHLDVKLGDFGFARFCVDKRSSQRQMSDTYCGSTAYVAPEVIRGTPYDPLTADIWSAGVCLFVILNNAMPFDDSNVTKLHKDQVKGNWRFSSKIEGTLSDSVKKLIVKMLEPNVQRRLNLNQVVNSSWMKR